VCESEDTKRFRAGKMLFLLWGFNMKITLTWTAKQAQASKRYFLERFSS
jgi:hypothetical protein